VRHLTEIADPPDGSKKESVMGDYPQMIIPVDHIEPVPRQIRAVLGGQVVLDTTQATYVWEWPYSRRHDPGRVAGTGHGVRDRPSDAVLRQSHRGKLDHLVPTDTVTSCPYKGKTSSYWTVRVGDMTYPDLAWAYDFPTRQLLPIAGLVAFYNEKVDVTVDGAQLPRPTTHFTK